MINSIPKGFSVYECEGKSLTLPRDLIDYLCLDGLTYAGDVSQQNTQIFLSLDPLSSSVNVYAVDEWQRLVDGFNLLPDRQKKTLQKYMFKDVAGSIDIKHEGQFIFPTLFEERVNLSKKCVIIYRGCFIRLLNEDMIDASFIDGLKRRLRSEEKKDG